MAKNYQAQNNAAKLTLSNVAVVCFVLLCSMRSFLYEILNIKSKCEI